MEEDYNKNNDVAIYNNLLDLINDDIYETYAKPLDVKINGLLNQIKDSLLEYGISEEEIANFVNDNVDMKIEDFYESFKNAFLNKLDKENSVEYEGEVRDSTAVIVQLFDELSEVQKEKTNIASSATSVEIQKSGNVIVRNSKGSISEDVTNYVKSSSYTVTDNFGNELTYDMSDTESTSTVRKNRDLKEEELKVNQAGTAAAAKTTISAAEANVREEELAAAIENLSVAKETEKKAKESFDTDNKKIEEPVESATSISSVDETNENSILKLNVLYPDPVTVALDSQQEDLLDKYDNVDDVPDDLKDAFEAAEEQLETYARAVENLDLRNEISNYQSQITNGNSGVIDNGISLLERISDKLSSLSEDPDSSDEQDQLEDIRVDVDFNNTTILANVDSNAIQQ